jgi:hypothetical protein
VWNYKPHVVPNVLSFLINSIFSTLFHIQGCFQSSADGLAILMDGCLRQLLCQPDTESGAEYQME